MFHLNFDKFEAHRNARFFSTLLCVSQLVANVDTLGVEGIYPVYLRVILRGLGFCLTVAPLMVSLYLTAKPIVPFVLCVLFLHAVRVVGFLLLRDGHLQRETIEVCGELTDLVNYEKMTGFRYLLFPSRFWIFAVSFQF